MSSLLAFKTIVGGDSSKSFWSNIELCYDFVNKTHIYKTLCLLTNISFKISGLHHDTSVIGRMGFLKRMEIRCRRTKIR